MKDTVGYKTEFGVKTKGSFIADGKISDGVVRIAAYQRLESFPVTVLVNRGLADVLADYEARRKMIFPIAAALTLLALVLAAMIQRSQRALRRAKAEIQQLEATDGLTNAMSRRAFLDLAEHEFSRAKRFQRPLAVLMLDLDHFKTINDTFGHPFGDLVLSTCAAAWKTALRDNDILGRMGGEEFCVILPECTLDSAARTAERLRQVIEELKFPSAPTDFSVTASIGYAIVSEQDANLAGTIERADRVLYQAKLRGRNRVEYAAE